MKKLLVAMTCALITVSAYGQGTINFANSAGTLITYQGTGVPVGQYTVALLYSATDPLGNASSMSSIATTGISPLAGRFLGGTATTPASTPAGNVAWFAVQAWQNTFASYAAAVAGGGIVGTSSIFSLATGGGGSPPGPATSLTAPGGFTGLAVAPVPEPSTIALGVLGVAALLLRRRK
jgi:hypothetical protein